MKVLKNQTTQIPDPNIFDSKSSITHLQNSKQLQILLRPVEIFLPSQQQWQHAANEARAMNRTVSLWQGAPSTREEDGPACTSLNGDPGVSWGRGAGRENWVFHMLGHSSDKGVLEILALKSKHLPLGSCLCAQNKACAKIRPSHRFPAGEVRGMAGWSVGKEEGREWVWLSPTCGRQASASCRSLSPERWPLSWSCSAPPRWCSPLHHQPAAWKAGSLPSLPLRSAQEREEKVRYAWHGLAFTCRAEHVFLLKELIYQP